MNDDDDVGGPERAIRSAASLARSFDATTKALGRVKRRFTWMWVAVGVMAVLMAIAVIAAAIAVRAVDEIKESHREDQVGNCQQDNIRIDQQNKLSETVRLILNLTNVPRDRTPEQQAQAEAFFRDAFGLLDLTIVPTRDCSPEGIATYLSTTTTTSIPGG